MAQAYRPLLVDSAMWYEYHHSLLGGNTQWTVLGDTTIAGMSYKRVVKSWIGEPFTVWEPWREDTLTRQVFVHYDGADRLVFDFGLQVGDTVTVHHRVGTDEPAPYALALDSITGNLGVGRTTTLADPRVMHLHDLLWSEHVTWVEGIGSFGGIEHQFNGDQDLLCHFDGNGAKDFDYPSLQSPSGSCLGVGYGSVAETSAEIELACYPNPVQESTIFTITVHGPSSPSQPLEILDASGRVVRRFQVRSGANTFPASGLDAGLYHLRLAHTTAVAAVQKLMVE